MNKKKDISEVSDDKLTERLVKRTNDRRALEAAHTEELIARRERIAEFRDRWANSALPVLPPDLIPGWHLFWATTTSTKDPIESRLALGYEFVKLTDLPEDQRMLHSTMTSGKYEGVINCNELLLMRLPMEIYQEAMTMLHHEDPLEHQLNITQKVREFAEEQRGSFSMDEGYLDMVAQAKRTINPRRFSG